MCSILSVIAFFIIAFTLISDYTALYPLELCEDTLLLDNGYKHSASCGQEKKGPGKTQLALTQAQVDFTATLEADTNQTDAPIASLQRSLIFGSYFSQHGDCQDGTMEVLALQKDLQ
jgi:hypothetical protein